MHIADTFKKSYEKFRDDKEVKKSMSVAEKLRLEGIQEGIQQGAAKVVELIKAGLSPDEALEEINDSTT